MPSVRVLFLVYLSANSIVLHSAAAAALVELKFSYVVSESAVDPVYGVRLDSTVPAVELALDHVNNNPTLLPGYTLQYNTVLRSECGQRSGLDTFFHDVLSESNLAVVGCACSQTTRAIAGVINYWNIPLVTCNPVSVRGMTPESSLYEHLFQLHPTARHYAAAVATFVQHFGWKRMAILSQEGDLYGEVESVLRGMLEPMNVSVIESRGQNNTSSSDAVGVLFPQDVRVFFLNSGKSHVKYILCKAYARKMFFPRYVWLTYSDGSGTLFASDGPHCEEGVLDKAIDGLFTISSVYNEGAEVLADLHRSLPLAAFAYDSILTLAMLLNRTLAVIDNGNVDCQNRNGTRVRLEDFGYDNDLMDCVFLDVLRSLSFKGTSGYVNFNSLGERKHVILGINQTRVKDRDFPSNSIAKINVSAGTMTFTGGVNSTIIFRGPTPSDGTPIKVINVQPLPLIITYYIIAFLGIVFTIVCFLFNIIFRKRKIVKLTSPNLNYFIILGALFLFGSIYIRVYFDSSRFYNDIRCNLQAILNCIGYALVMAPVLAKMWRVYYIFHNPLTKKKGLKDWHLSLVVMGVVSVILLMVILSATVPTLRPDLVLRVDKERPHGLTSDGVRIDFCAWKCYDTKLPFIWVAMEYAYLFLLQVVAVVLAFKTRKVKIKELNDSKSVAAIIYFTSIVMASLMIITFASDGYIVVAETLFSGGIMLATAVFLGFTFIPKMVALCKDPEGEGVMKSSTTVDTASSAYATSSIGGTDENHQNIYKLSGKRSRNKFDENSAVETAHQLRRKIAELENQLKTYKNA